MGPVTQLSLVDPLAGTVSFGSLRIGYVIMTCKGLMTKREWNGHYRLPTYWFYALDVMVNPT